MSLYTPAKLFDLSGRVVFLSGAAGHLGKEMALGFAGAGALVVLNGRTSDKLQSLAQTIRTAGGQAEILAGDVAKPGAATELVSALRQKFGRLDVLVNNAYAGRAATVETSTAQDFDEAYRVSVTAAFNLVQAALPLLSDSKAAAAGGASVINLATMYAVVSPDPGIYGTSGANNPPFYGAAKAGLIQLTRYLAVHLAPHRIRVNSISPGPFPQPELATVNPEFHEKLCSKNPMKRIGRAAELVGPALFLASDASSYVTGANLAVDGGWTAW